MRSMHHRKRNQSKTSSVRAENNTRPLLNMAEAAREAGVSYRFLQMEIARGRLVAVRLSTRVVRIRRGDWDRYLAGNLTGAEASHV